MKDVLKDHIANDMRSVLCSTIELKILTHSSYLSAQIEEQIRAEIALQVKQEVAAQIGEHLPVSLEQQAEASKRQLVEVKHSLVNSLVYLACCLKEHIF